MSERINSLIVKLIYLMIAGIVVTQAFGLHSFSSLSFYMVMLLTACLWISRAAKGIDQINMMAIWIAIASVVNVLIDAVTHAKLFQLSDLTKLFSFLLAVLFFAVLSGLRTDRKTINFVFHVNTCIAVFWLLMYASQWTKMHLFYGQVSRYLTFRFTNPNLTALFLLCCAMVELVGFLRERRWVGKCIHLLVAGVLVSFIWETGARNGLIALGIFLVVWLLAQFFPRKPFSISGWMRAGFAVFPGLFAAAYMLVINSAWVQALLGFMTSAGKELDSRVGIWRFAWNTFLTSPITGSFTQVLHGTSQSHMHNSHVDILASYGVVVLILVCVFLYYVATAVNKNTENRASRLALWAFAAVLMTGMGEASLFSGGLGIYAYAGVFLLIANEKGEDALQ